MAGARHIPLQPHSWRDWPFFYAFDLVPVDGEDLRDWPLIERKRRLRQLIPSVPTRLYVD